MSQQINLYDAALLKPRELVTAQTVGLSVLALAILIGVVNAVQLWRLSGIEDELAVITPQVASLQKEARGLEDKLKNLKPDAALEQDLSKSKALLETRTEVLSVLEKGLGIEAMSFAEIMRGYARQTPQGIWLTGFKANIEFNAMEIRGRTQSANLLPEYIRRLNAEKAFKGQAFSALSINAVMPTAAPTATTGVAPQSSGATAAAATAMASPSTPTASAVTAPPNTQPLYHEFILTPAVKLPAEVKP